MKIERLSENQIRCTLNKADLAEKELKISELAYGTAKAKALFKEMMQQASIELGFEVDDIPLMIEAIPVSPDCLILIVTKVEDPDELDTRFSRFSRANDAYLNDDAESDDEYYIDDDTEETDTVYDSHHTDDSTKNDAVANTIFDAIEGLVNSISGLAASKGQLQNVSEDSVNVADVPVKKTEIFRIFIFDSISTIVKASKQVAGFYFSNNTLYKNPATGCFYLLIKRDNNTASEFSRICNILNEYGTLIKTSYAMPYHFDEHYKTIIQENAIQTLSAL